MINQLICGDCLKILPPLPPDSVDLILTDPPYFLHNLGNNTWQKPNLTNSTTITSLSSGMKFDKNQGKRLYEWYKPICQELLRVLKPGGFFFSFSAPRLYAHMCLAIEDAGFLIKDMFIWLYVQNQAKAMGLNHVIDRLKISDEEKENLKAHLSGWKTPQVKSCHEPIVMAQKPLEGSFLDNYAQYGVGLVDTNQRLGDDMFPSNVASTDEFDGLDRYFLVSKPTKQEKGEFNHHLTAKPVSLCKYLINLTTREDQVVLDPFAGSGTTCVAAKQTNRHYIGIELNGEYVNIAQRRISDAN